jgi:hypothetical protein
MDARSLRWEMSAGSVEGALRAFGELPMLGGPHLRQRAAFKDTTAPSNERNFG